MQMMNAKYCINCINNLDEDTCQRHNESLKKIIKYIKDNCFDAYFNINEISYQLGISRSRIWELAKSHLFITPNLILENLRIEKAIELMKDPEIKLNRVAFESGLNLRNLRNIFHKRFKMTPTQFRDMYYSNGYTDYYKLESIRREIWTVEY